MTYTFPTTNREKEIREIVRRPRATDLIGNTLRGAFDDSAGLPDDMARLLRQLDGRRAA